MPPRIPSQSIQCSLSSSQPPVSRLQCAYQGRQRILPFSSSSQQNARPAPVNKHTPNAERGAERAEMRATMYKFLNQGVGSKLRQPLKGSTNYLNAYRRSGQLVRKTPKDKEIQEGREARVNKNELPPETTEDLRPYPLNKHFLSQPVLSEELRTEIWKRVMELGEPIKVVSSSYGVSIERVAAVVRMKEMEKNWQQEGKPLATPYSRAVLEMLPKTPLVQDPNNRPVHESVNDLYVHPATKAQIFYPVSESRQFTREDAGHAFDTSLLPTEKRIPHPEMVQGHRWMLDGLSEQEFSQKMKDMLGEEQRKQRRKEELRLEKEAKEVRIVSAGKWDFKFREMNAAAVGKDGRDPKAVGFRYGAPHEDRKKGQIKIPRKVLG